MDDKHLDIRTIAARTWLDSKRESRPLSVPIVQAVNFQAESSAALSALFHDGADSVYQRFGHPTIRAAEEKIRELEGAEGALMFGSGMGAIATMAMALVAPAPAHVVAQRQIFGQTFTLLDQTLRSLGVETTFVNGADRDELRAALRPNTRFVYIESPSNPLLKIVDIRAAAEIAHGHGVPLVIDGTFASPILQRPLALGADLVIHSATKFLSGHSDVMAGAVAGRGDLIRSIASTQILLGTILDPHAAWLVLRGIRTLELRVREQSKSALTIAHYLRSRPEIVKVFYPFLEGTEYAVARSQMSGGGGVVSFVAGGGREGARAFVEALELISIATSLGGVESVIEIPAELDWSRGIQNDAATGFGIPDGLIRLSVGIEHIDDLLADLRHGVAALERSLVTK